MSSSYMDTMVIINPVRCIATIHNLKSPINTKHETILGSWHYQLSSLI
uniref:Uncharacterized protein n=1 Tax=Nelumbo nucifera TaxID=4432 RepID=A0A822ZN80_NELNU|nr:TPA_asm: hypothetical protein HUJ06_016619 [Nelumbo nucifera]